MCTLFYLRTLCCACSRLGTVSSQAGARRHRSEVLSCPPSRRRILISTSTDSEQLNSINPFMSCGGKAELPIVPEHTRNLAQLTRQHRIASLVDTKTDDTSVC